MDAFTLESPGGLVVRFISLGGIIASLCAPDRKGQLADLTPGYDTLDAYRADTRYMGALIGRYANRIANAQFTLEGITYELPRNDGRNHLHGGPGGFHKLEWSVSPDRSADGSTAVLHCTSPDGDQGYPGKVECRVTYTVTHDNTLSIDYHAVTDAPTPLNLSQHLYLNLAGQDCGDILDHELMVNASHVLPVDRSMIPTGVFRGVVGTAFDLTTPRRIGDVVSSDDEQMKLAGGIDHTFVIRQRAPGELTLAATLYDRSSGRWLEVLTTEPGVQVYTGNGLADGPLGKGGYAYRRYGAIALETQHFPDSPNQPAFPSTIVTGEYRSRTVYRFGIRQD
jgi:aldose 1-epimerase